MTSPTAATSPGPAAPLAGRAPQILDAFTRLVAERGYDGTNFADVAAEVGVSKGLIAHHFTSKDRLLGLVHESYMRRRLSEQARLRAASTSPAEQVAGLTFATALWHVHDRYAAVAFQREIVRLAAIENLDEGRRLRGEYLAAFRAILRAGIALGEFRPVDVPLTSLLASGSAQWMWTWYDPDGPESPAQVGGAAVDFVLGSLLADAHRTRLAGLADPTGPVARRAAEIVATSSSEDR